MARKVISTLLLLMGVLICAPSAARADGAVYAMTNAVGDNRILVYHRADNGTLTLMQTIATGGGGSGLQLAGPDSLGSQGGLILDDAHHRLFAVNTETAAASSQDCQEGSISSFLVKRDGSLALADRVMSGGLYPDSVTLKQDILYVLNAGGPGASPACGRGPNITGFTVDRLGFTNRLSGSVQPIDPGPLDGTGAGVDCNVGGFAVPSFDCGLNPPAFPRSPAKIGFTPDGRQLVVTVKGTNSIYVFPVGKHGRAGTPTVTQAPGPALPTYFGFTFDREAHLIVTEAFGQSQTIPAAGAAAISSFTITRSGALRQISASIGDRGTAACWVALDPGTGHYAYVSNNISNGISSYSVSRNGKLTLLAATAAAANGPNDLAVASEDGSSFVYVLDAGDGTIGAFEVNPADGSLMSLGAVSGLPTSSAAGLAAY